MNMPRKDAAVGTIVIVLVLACSDNTGPGNRPHAIEIVSGDGQGALPGEMAPEPLRVRVTDAKAQPLARIPVSWSVTSGAATLTPVQSTTDARGEAETRVTITGKSSAEVRATVGGLSPLTFSIPVLDPCLISSARPISLEVTVTGTLHELDCDLDEGRFRDLYSFSVSTQQLVTVRVRATAFDPVGTIVAREANGGYFDRGSTADTADATRLAIGRWILPSGDYLVSPTSAGGPLTGPYELLVSALSAAPAGCEPTWIVRGVTTAQVLATTDCTDPAGPIHHDVFFLLLWIGERVTLTHTSPEFAPRLRLFRRGGALITESDGSATGTALITFTADETALYILHATSASTGRSGAYTLAVIAGGSGATASRSGAPRSWQLMTSPSPQ